ncbi:MAG: SPOR domain-containing protein [Magnetococcales bacterium]|nr:SPOR domain-containing protein [Magnetococcales bacterium]MBF0420952.1 SPOR domain-containing protein [Magnetococcales bacterium]
MPSRISGIMGLLAWAMALLLLMGNLGYYSKLILSHKPEQDVWTGSLMPGKRYPLPDISQAKVIKGSGTNSGDEVNKVKPTEEKVAESKPKEEKKEVKRLPPPVEAKVETKVEPKVDTKIEDARGQFVVLVGDFVLELGMESLLKRLKDNGLQPRTGVKKESVRLNNVQAGPFLHLEDAKVAETVLKSHGYEAEVVETWEGFIISMSRSLLLGEAVADMEKGRSLGVKPVRMVKIEVDMPVNKVFFGPFISKEEALKMSERVAKLGLSVPVIKPWEPGAMGQEEKK